MTKINIAELLKDCPKGMELDCTMYDGLEFDSIDESIYNGSIKCIIKCQDGGYIIHRFNKYGLYDDTPHSKCVIFPKGKTTWEGFQPPCQFKDGDVISNLLGTCIFKGEGRIKGTVDYYCGVVHTNYFNVKDKKSNPCKHYGNIVDYRFATEEEKQKLFDAIKANGYKWNAETTTLEKLVEPKFKVGDRIKKGKKIATIVRIYKDFYDITHDSGIGSFTIDLQDEWELISNKFDINTLKPFESRVLVRDEDLGCRVGENYWKAAIYGCYIDGLMFPYHVIGGLCFHYCIPYEGNEHLLGTTDDCSDYYKTWEE